jgi:uncharacterized protein YkwD
MRVRKALSLGLRPSGYRNKEMKNIQTPISGRGGLPSSNNVSFLDAMLTLLFAVTLICLSANGVTTAQTMDARNVSMSFRLPTATAESSQSIERRVFELINREREQNGVRPLVWIERAANIARIHSNNMARNHFFGHEGLDGRMVADRADKSGLSNWNQIGENIAWISGYDDPATRAVLGWMRSPGHRRNILDRKYAETGLGLAIADDGKYYFTQVFVSPR